MSDVESWYQEVIHWRAHMCQAVADYDVAMTRIVAAGEHLKRLYDVEFAEGDEHQVVDQIAAQHAVAQRALNSIAAQLDGSPLPSAKTK